MSFQLENTLAGYARAAVDLKTRMWEASQTHAGRTYTDIFAAARYNPDTRPLPDTLGLPPLTDGPARDNLLQVVHQLTSQPWKYGEPYVLAPAMTAVVAAAASALDLTGETLPAEVAPSDNGVLFLPEPIYHRHHDGSITGLDAITWTRYTNQHGTSPRWAISGWADRTDPHDPFAHTTATQFAAVPNFADQLGPYLLTDIDTIPIGEPLPNPTSADSSSGGSAAGDEPDSTWEPAPDGRYCLTHQPTRTPACIRLAYAFWRIQAQPLAVTATTALDRNTRRRATLRCPGSSGLRTQ